MDYERAEREFRRLEELRQTGFLTEEAYRTQLAALRVIDEWGRLWMLQERTGQWFVYHEGQWVAATPPRQQAATGPAPLQEGYATSPASSPGYAAAQPVRRGEVRRRRPAGGRRRMGCAGITFRIFLWDLVWLGAVYALYRWVGPRLIGVYIGLGILAAVTLFFWVRLMGQRRTLETKGTIQ